MVGLAMSRVPNAGDVGTSNRAVDDDDFEDAPVEALIGSVTPAGDTSDLGNVLLEMTGAAAKVAVLISELDEDEYRGIASRLAVFLSMVSRIPTTPRKKRRIGFVKPTPRTKRKSKKKQKR
jgi:hypothetical protein